MKKRSFKVGGQLYDIPEAEVSGFLKDFPDAVEIKTYKVGDNTYDIPLTETNQFEIDMGLKKKDGGSVSKNGTTPSDPFSARSIAGVGSTIQPSPTSRNPYAGVFDISSKAGFGPEQTNDLYNKTASGDLQPLVDIVKNKEADINSRKETFRKTNKPEASGQMLYDSDVLNAVADSEEKKAFAGDEEDLKELKGKAAGLIDAAMADKLIKSDDAFYSAKKIGDERRRLRSDIGEEVGYKDEVGNISAVESLKNKFHYGVDLPTKEKQTQQLHDYLNEKGIYESALKTLDGEMSDLEKTDQVQKFNELDKIKNPSAEQQQQMQDLLSDPTVNDYVKKKSRGQNFAQRLNQLPRSYPTILVEQRREQLANAWANRVINEDEMANYVPGQQAARQFRKIFVGDKPTTDEEFEYLSKEANIPVEDVKMLINAPGSSIGIPSRLGRVWNSAQGVIGSSIEGANRMAYDQNEANVLNKQLDKTSYRPAEPLQNRKWSVDKVIDTMADGLGQFAGYVAGTELLGAPLSAASRAIEGVGEAAQLGRTAATSLPGVIRGIEKAKDIGGTFATGYLSSFEDAYQYAASQSDDEDKRQDYAKSVAIANGLSELILKDVDVAKKILKGKNSEDVLNRFLNRETPFTSGDVLKARLGEFAKTLGYESLEELIPYFTEVFQKDNVFGNKMSASEIYQGALDTVVQTAISTVPMGAFSSISVPTQSVMENALLEAAKTPERFNQKWEDMYNKGSISEDQMNKNIQTTNTVADIYKKLPNTINGEPITEEQQGKLINLVLGKRQLKNQKENVDEALHGVINEQEKVIDEKIKEATQPKQNKIRVTADQMEQLQKQTQQAKESNSDLSEVRSLIEQLPEGIYTNVLRDAAKDENSERLTTMLKEIAQQMNSSENEMQNTRKVFGEVADIAQKMFPNQRVGDSTTEETDKNVRYTDYLNPDDIDKFNAKPSEKMIFNQGNGSFGAVTLLVDEGVKAGYKNSAISTGNNDEKTTSNQNTLKQIAKGLRKDNDVIVDLRGIDLSRPVDEIINEVSATQTTNQNGKKETVPGIQATAQKATQKEIDFSEMTEEVPKDNKEKFTKLTSDITAINNQIRTATPETLPQLLDRRNELYKDLRESLGETPGKKAVATAGHLEMASELGISVESAADLDKKLSDAETDEEANNIFDEHMKNAQRAPSASESIPQVTDFNLGRKVKVKDEETGNEKLVERKGIGHEQVEATTAYFQNYTDDLIAYNEPMNNRLNKSVVDMKKDGQVKWHWVTEDQKSDKMGMEMFDDPNGKPITGRETLYEILTGEGYSDQQRGMAAAYIIAQRITSPQLGKKGSLNNFNSNLFNKAGKGVRIFFSENENSSALNASPNGEITINAYKMGQRLRAYMQNGGYEKSLLTWAEVAVSEELLHLATFKVSTKQELEQIYDEMSEEERDLVKKLYGSDFKIGTETNRFALAAEYVRMVMQEKVLGRISSQYNTAGLTGTTTEMFRPGMQRKHLREHFSKLITWLKKVFSDSKSKTAKDVINRLEDFIKGKPTQTVNSEAVVGQPNLIAIQYGGREHLVQIRDGAYHRVFRDKDGTLKNLVDPLTGSSLIGLSEGEARDAVVMSTDLLGASEESFGQSNSNIVPEKRILGLQESDTLLSDVLKTGSDIISKRRDDAIKREDTLGASESGDAKSRILEQKRRERLDKQTAKLAKDIKSGTISWDKAIEGQSDEFIESLASQVNPVIFNDQFRNYVRRLRDSGYSSDEVKADLSARKKLTKAERDIIDDEYTNTYENDPDIQALRENLTDLQSGKGDKRAKSVAVRLLHSRYSHLVKFMKEMSYEKLSLDQMEKMVDQIIGNIPQADLEQFINGMHDIGLADLRQIARAKAIVLMDKSSAPGSKAAARRITEAMADEATVMGRQTKTLVRSYEILKAHGSPATKSNFARQYVASVNKAAEKKVANILKDVNDAKQKMESLNDEIHQEAIDKILESELEQKRLQEELDRICNTRRKRK